MVLPTIAYMFWHIAVRVTLSARTSRLLERIYSTSGLYHRLIRSCRIKTFYAPEQFSVWFYVGFVERSDTHLYLDYKIAELGAIINPSQDEIQLFAHYKNCLDNARNERTPAVP